VAAGDPLTYTLTARNLGSTNTAYRAGVSLALPPDVTFSSAAPGCTHSAGTVTCPLGDLAPGASATRTVTASVPADLVANNGGPKTIEARAAVRHDGLDPSPSDNTATTTTLVIAVADVRVVKASLTGPVEVLIGQSEPLTTKVEIDNLGPSSPIDTRLTTTTTSGPGVVVTPQTDMSEQALAIGPPLTVPSTRTATCVEPGLHEVQLTAALELANTADVDPDLTNNTLVAETITIDCVIPIAVNVRPGGFPNSVNLNTDATLAALTTRAGEYGLPFPVDATQIVGTSVRWGLRGNLLNTATPTGAPEIHNTVHPERSYELNDRTRDADLDAVMHFKPAASGLTLSSTQACLKGRLVAGTKTYTVFGCDAVRVVN
jgi:hypothetical protein